MRGLSRYGRHIITAFIIKWVDAFICTIGLLLRKERAEAAIALPSTVLTFSSASITKTLIRGKVVVILRLIIRTLHVIN